MVYMLADDNYNRTSVELKCESAPLYKSVGVL